MGESPTAGRFAARTRPAQARPFNDYAISVWSRCANREPPDTSDELLGDWLLRGGDKDTDCGSGSQHELLEGTHQVRVVEGSTSDFTLQFFNGTEMTGPVVCEFAYNFADGLATLAQEHSCGTTDNVVTWHTGTMQINFFGYLALETHLTSGAGCIVDARPVYQRLPEGGLNE